MNASLGASPPGIQTMADLAFVADRQFVDFVEIAYLSMSICVGTVLNLFAVARLLRYSKRPTTSHGHSSHKSRHCLLRPLYMNSFTMLKFNLAITDFAILLIHALGKTIWLLSYQWLLGDLGCRLYQFLSAFAYYSNSNVVVAIGLDRLKVVYSGRVQGASSSIRRVRLFLTVAWVLAAISALPQLFFWTNFEFDSGWSQCTTIWQIASHSGQNATLQQKQMMTDWSVSEHTQMMYELLHQAAVFVIPFISLSVSYLLIVIRVLRYTFRPAGSANFCSSYSSFNGAESAGAGADRPSPGGSYGRHRKRSSRVSSWRLRTLSTSRYFLQLLQHHSQQQHNTAQLRVVHLDPSSASPVKQTCQNGGGPPPTSPQNAQQNGHNAMAPNRTPPAVSHFPHFSADYSSVDLLLASKTLKREQRVAAKSPGSNRRLSAMETHSVRGTADARGRRPHEAAPKRCSLNAVVEEAVDLPPSSDTSCPQARTQIGLAPLHPANGALGALGHCAASHRFSLGKRSVASATSGGGGGFSPLWRRQLRSKVFIRSLLIVVAHCAFWLPYNLLNLLRFTDESLYTRLVDRGALLVEDLVVMNSLINPVLYGYGK